MMKPTYFGAVSAIAMASLLAACAIQPAPTMQSQLAPAGPEVATQHEAGELAFRYGQQAAHYRDLATRFDIEARWYGGRFGEQDPQARQSQAKAQQLWAAAEEAEELAREYRRQVPHGRMY